MFASADNGLTWSAPAALNGSAATDSRSDSAPQIAADGAGNWLAVWNSSENIGGAIGLDADILVARSTDNGLTWTAPAPLNNNAATDSGGDLQVQFTTDGLGTWVAVWATSETFGGTMDTDLDIVSAVSADNGVTWTDPEPVNSYACSDLSGDAGKDVCPQVTTDGAGHWVVVWETHENLRGPDADYEVMMARSNDNGSTWTKCEPVNRDYESDYGENYCPQVTTDGAGHWVMVWQSQEDLGGHRDRRRRRGRPSRHCGLQRQRHSGRMRHRRLRR